MKYSRMFVFSLRFSAVGIALLAFMLIVYPPLATAFGFDLSSDSEIVLIEKPGDAPYRSLSIGMLTQNGNTTLTVVKDGQKTETNMPSENCHALWKYMLEKDVHYLENPSADVPQSPGASMFTLKVREGSETHTWTAYDVDSLADPRYREIVRQIFNVVKASMP